MKIENYFRFFWVLAALAAITLFSSCTHWLIDTESRIQVENKTSRVIYGLSAVSKTGQLEVFVPDTLENGKKSKVYENEWVGEFNFVVFLENEPNFVNLGVYKLKGGSVLLQIKENENGEFTIFGF